MQLTQNLAALPNLDEILSLSKDMQIKIPTLWGRRLWVGRLRHPKHPTSTKQAKKNETAAGVALVLVAAVDL